MHPFFHRGDYSPGTRVNVWLHLKCMPRELLITPLYCRRCMVEFQALVGLALALLCVSVDTCVKLCALLLRRCASLLKGGFWCDTRAVVNILPIESSFYSAIHSQLRMDPRLFVLGMPFFVLSQTRGLKASPPTSLRYGTRALDFIARTG